MHILLTNDDGLMADGLIAAYQALIKAGHRVTACAPDRERSAQSQAVTLRHPILVQTQTMPDGALGFATSGTPADCARLGFTALAPVPVDLVISGINNDSNLGFDVNYSGTVAAALEAAGAGFPAIAASLERSEHYNWKQAGQILTEVIDTLPSWSIPQGIIINLNIPAKIQKSEWVWVKPNPNPGQDYYQLQPGPDGSASYLRLRDETLYPCQDDTDLAYIRAGLITLSPLVSVTCHKKTLARLQNPQPDFPSHSRDQKSL